MKNYKIPVSWEMYAWIDIQANSLKEAIKIAESDNTPLPKGEYVDGSFDVDKEIIENDYGFQIVRVMHRENSAVKPMEEVRPEIADALYRQKAEPEMKEFMESLVDESFIYIASKYTEQFNVEGLI